MTSPQIHPSGLPAPAPSPAGDEAFLDLYEESHDRVAILDPSGRILFANRALRTLIAPHDAPLAGHSVFDIVHPHDHATCQAWVQTACRQVAGGRSRMFLLAHEGRQIPVETAGTPILEGDHRGGIHAVFTDLTERHRETETLRESDTLLHLLSQHAPCGVFITDAAGRLRFANRRWRTLADLLHVAQPQGVWWQMVHPDDRDRVLTQWQSAQHGTREFTSEFRVNSPGRDVRWVRTRIAHSWTSEGRIACSVGVTEDITLQRQADDVLRQAQEQLEELVHGRTEALQQANRELTDLVYAVTHDLKAPLRGVARLAELLGEDHAERLGEDGRLLIGKLQGRVRKLHALIDGILAYSRVGRGLGPESLVDLNRLVAELSKLLDPPPTFTIRTPEPLPTVSGVPHQLHQVFLNLFDNAIKFHDKPEGRIQVSCRRVGSAWEFSVSDNGPGIPARFHEKIFGLFQRLELLPDRPGTGVGLALVKRIIERRGGEIQVASEEGVGTTFRFTWPDSPPRTVQPI